MNISRDSLIPITHFGGTTLCEVNNVNNAFQWACIYAGEGGFSDFTSLPDGNYPPVTFRLPMKAGAITMRDRAEGLGSISANGVLGYPGGLSMSGSGGLTSADGSMLAFIVLTVLGSGDLTADATKGLYGILAASGLGGLTGDLGDGVDRRNIAMSISSGGEITLNMALGKYIEASMSGSGNVVAAITAIGHLVSEISSSGGMTISPSALGHMELEMTPFTELSPENLARSVWETIATEFNDSGTMGQKLNSASTGGVDYEALGQAVWEYYLAGVNDPGSAADILKKAKQAAQNAFASSV